MILIIGGSYQGKTEFARSNFSEYKFLNQLHLLIKKRIEEGKNQGEIYQEIHSTASSDNYVVIADEVGNGVVPISDSDRLWREITGRILCQLASEATEVYRVVCGVGQRIK